ncbi:hypothetical protein PTW37_08965 [Arthrobacter agilis]|uniref:hypothetical protein n=1 Tax=Arthrobacter agilis TaxID=37921 RepID=UPI002366798E|nr:hypothetical protein [Arthrobacter agilis]WDF32022.1 hypothetical protein PTW37_08965 [Arthrobacter agilis]
MVDDPSGWHDVVVADSLIRVSLAEPVAVIRRRGVRDRVVSWADLPVGPINPRARIAAAPSGAWVVYTPATADEMAERGGIAARVTSTVVHVSPSGDVVRFMDLADVHLLGATRHGLWLSSGRWDANPDTEQDWLTVRELLVLDAGGTTHRSSVDRIPLLAFEDDPSPHLIVHAAAPDATPDGVGGACYTYRHLQLDLPAEGIPAALRVGEHPAASIEERDIPGWSEDDAPPPHPAVAGDPRVPWDMADLSEAERTSAVDAACAEFGDLDEYWQSAVGVMLPLTDGVQDARVTVIGDWPETRIEVTFTHPHYPQGRLRRTHRVFDDAGRIRSVQYASIHLMEDLDTRALPPAGNARNTILDI